MREVGDKCAVVTLLMFMSSYSGARAPSTTAEN